MTDDIVVTDTLRVSWVDDWPEEARKAVEPYVRRMGMRLPTWCREMQLKWDSTSRNIARCTVSKRNRWVVVYVCSLWLEEPEEARWNALVHEVAHVYLGGMSDCFLKVVKQLPEGAAQEVARQWYYDAEEEAVSDLSYQLMATQEIGDDLTRIPNVRS